jgi:hypothetical protein
VEEVSEGELGAGVSTKGEVEQAEQGQGRESEREREGDAAAQEVADMLCLYLQWSREERNSVWRG